MSWILFTLAVVAALVALLNFRPAPSFMWTWKLAIIAAEYGYWFVLPVLGLAGAAWLGAPDSLRPITLICCLLALAGFLRPVWAARRLAATLARDLPAAFGGGPAPLQLNLVRLFRVGGPPPTARQTEVFARPDGQELKLDFYRPAGAPETGAAPRPCVVVIHGGGWEGGDRAQLAWWNPRLVARGYAVAAISYRLAPRWIWPAQRDDVLAALAFLKDRAGPLGIDPGRLVLFGRSAGGQLATAVGYGAGDPAIRGVIALYAPHDMPFTWSVSREDDALNSARLMRQYFGGAPEGERRAHFDAASGQGLARPGSPPTLLLHGTADTLSWYRHSERLAARLQELGVPHHFLRLPWATHGFDFNPDGPGGQLADHAIGQFLATVTR